MQITKSSLDTTPGPGDWFTGAVYIDTVATPAEPSRVGAASVHFTPGARTAWHTHPNGQTIYVTEGIGLCQRRGGPIEIIRPGDRVFFEPKEDHWHGAAPNRFMTHIAMQQVDDQGSPVTWGPLLRCGEKPLGEAPTVAEREAQGLRVQRLLDVTTGVVLSLPERTDWTRAGTRYLEGEPRYTEGAGACPPRIECVDLYDIQTGVVSVRDWRHSKRSDALERVDLSRVGAPYERVCRALRGAVRAQLKYRSRGEGFAYGGGVFAHPTHDSQNVRVERCSGRSTFLPGPSESGGPDLRRPEPRDFDLGEGSLTWDTGHGAAGADMDEQSNERGALSGYELTHGKLRTWKLPRLSISGNPELESPGVYGYSTHAADFVLWIATRRIYQEGEAGGTIVATSSVYGARL